MERKASDILSDRRKIRIHCLSNPIVLMCLWSPLPFCQNCKKVRNQRCITFTMSKSIYHKLKPIKATGHHFKYVRPKSRHRTGLYEEFLSFLVLEISCQKQHVRNFILNLLSIHATKLAHQE